LVMGILVQKTMKKVRVQSIHLYHCLVAFIAILSHGILDKLARFTYHPPMPLPEDEFWVSYHSIIVFLTVFIFYRMWRGYKIGLIFSIFPDFDWVVLHLSNLFSIQIPFYKEPLLHKFFFSFLDWLPPFSFLSSLPNWNSERLAVITEFGVLAFICTLIMRKRKKTLTLGEKPVKFREGIITCDWVDKLSIYLSAMDHESKIRTSYQSLLTSLEVALFGLVITLYQLKLTDLLWLFPIGGVAICFFFGIACEFRARNIDVWRVQIVEVVKGTDLEEAFEEAKYRWIPFGKAGFWGEYLFGHWFERIFVTSILIAWVTVVFFLPTPFILRPLSIWAACFFIIYIFRLIEPRGKIIPYIMKHE